MLATIAVALSASGAASANEPFWTQQPDLTVQGGRLYASNGGWTSYSGPVTKNLYRFLRDGVVVKGLTGDLPKSTPPDLALPGVTPDDPDAPYYTLSPGDSGHCFTAEVWGGIRSTYVTQEGQLVYDVWEWGHLNDYGQPAVTNQVCVGAVAEPAHPASSLALGPQTLRGARANLPWSQQLVALGGAGPYSFRLTAGSLPKGMALSVSGLLSGTPDAPVGTYPFTVASTDAAGGTGSLELTFTVLPPRVRFATAALPTARVGTRYRARLAVIGGSSVRTFTFVRGKLPPGIVLGRDGFLHGRATSRGAFSFTIQSRDANGVTCRRYFVLRVR